MYSISHPDHRGCPLVDLSKDPKATVSISLSPIQLVLERVISIVFHHYAIPLEITDSIRATFRSKLWRMRKTLWKLGGPRRSQQIEQWKDTASLWSFTVNSSEVCRQVHKRKCEVEKQLCQEVTKRRKIEESVHSLKEEVKVLKKAQRSGKAKSKRKGSKEWDSYSRQQRSNIKKQLSSDFKSALSNCTNEHFKPVSLQLLNSSSGSETLDLNSMSFSKSSTDSKLSDANDTVNFALFVKDKFCLSDEGYHEISLLSRELPRLHTVKKLTKSLNSQASVTPTVGVVGVEQKLQDRLILHLTEMQRKGELDSLLRDNNCIRIKLSDDGTQVGRSVHVINFTFTFVDRDTAESVAGNHTLAW